jgi:hypothetical protein
MPAKTRYECLSRLKGNSADDAGIARCWHILLVKHLAGNSHGAGAEWLRYSHLNDPPRQAKIIARWQGLLRCSSGRNTFSFRWLLMRRYDWAVVAAWSFTAVGGLVYAHTGGFHARSESGRASS